MSLNLAVDGDNSSCAFVGATAGSGVSLGGVLGCGSSSGSSGDGSPNGWSGKNVPPATQAVSSISTSAAVAPSVSVATSGHLPNSSLGSWNLNSPTPSSNSHFASTSMQPQQLPQPSPLPQQQPPQQQQQHSTPSPPSQQQTQQPLQQTLQLQPHSQPQQANPSNGTGAMTTVISGDIIVDSQDNEAWPSITSMTSTTSTTGSNNNGNANKPVSNVTSSAASAVSTGQISGGTPGVLMMNPPSASANQETALNQPDVWGTTGGSAGSSWGGPFAQPPTVTSSSSLASLWGGSSGINSDPNYSPWGNANSVMPPNSGSLWNNNAVPSATSPQEQTSSEWNAQQPSQSQQHQNQDPQRQQLMQQMQQHHQAPQQAQQQPQNHQPQLMQQQPVAMHNMQQQQQRQHSQQQQPHNPQQRQQQSQQLQSNQSQQSQMQQMQQQLHSMPQQQPPPPPLQQQSSQSSQAQSPTWSTGNPSGPGSSGWLHSAGPSSRATPTNEVAAITSQDSTDSVTGQTWAQAAGKGVSETTTPVPGAGNSGVKSPEDLIKDENERQVWALVNSNDGWGKRPVNQATPWDCGLVKEDQMKHVDSNVWMNEPPNGTGQWEHHYESLGEKTARWSVLSKSSSTGGASGGPSGNQWGRSTSVSGAEIEGPFWNGQTQSWERGSRNAPPARLHSVSGVPSGSTGTWGSDDWSSAPSHRSSVSDASDWNRGTDQWMGASGATTPTNPGGPNLRWGQQGQDDNSNMWSNPQSQSGSIRSSMHSDDFNRRMPMSNNSGGGNRNNMRAHVIRKLMDMGFRREDAQQALISHNMNFDRALQELQNKRSMSNSGAGDYPHSGSGLLPRNQQMNMQNHAQQQQVQLQQQQQSQVHQQQSHMQQQQQAQQHQQQQQQQNQPPVQQHQQQQQHHQQQLMRQQIMTQLQASVQNRMQAGNGNNGGMQQVSGGNQTNFQNNTVYQQQHLQNQLHQVKQQITLLQHRGKTLQTQFLQATATGNVTASRTLQQQIEQVNTEMQNCQKHIQSINMKMAQLQNAPQHQHQQQQSQHQHYSQSAQHHMGSNMMNQQQMNHDRQYGNPLNDMIDRMSGLMGPTNGMTGNHMNVSGWKSSEQNAAGWYNMGLTDDQQRSHAPNQNNLTSSAQVSNLSMDIPEFVPGKPWQGMKDDPNMTVGGSRKGVFNTLNNDHLEKLSTKDNNARSPQSPSGPYASNHRRHHGGYNGTSSMYHQYGSPLLLIRNMPSNVTVDLIKLMVAQHGPVVAIQPNLNAGWVLIRFANPEDAVKAQKSLISAHFGQVEIISENEAQRLQQEIQALAARFNPNTAWSNNFVGVGDALPPETHLIPGDI